MASNKCNIGWNCSMVPEEIIYAAGLIPKRILQVQLDNAYSSEFMPVNFSTFAKGCLDNIIDGRHDLQGIILTPGCTSSEFIFDAINDKKSVDFLYMLDVPRKRNGEALIFFSEQLRRLADSIEQYFNVQISHERLRKTINLFNSIRTQLGRLKQLLHDGNISGSTFFDVAVMAATTDKQEALNKLKASVASAECQDRIADVKKRILLLGSPLQSQEMLLEIERHSGRIVFDDTCIAGTYMGSSVKTEGDLFDNLAYAYLNSRLCSRMETKMDRINYISNLLNSCDADGVIYNLAKFRICDCYESVMLNEELFSKRTYPHFIVIENENRGKPDAVTLTKIETFMQIL